MAWVFIRSVLTAVIVTAASAAFGGAAAQSYGPNGYGADPDGDSNPAVDTRLIARIGDAAEAALDPPFKVITFEAPPGKHGERIANQYARKYGVTFEGELFRQICEGPRYFRYDSECTYMRAPSGRFAALHKDRWGDPLKINFAAPVCAAALALYPTGGREGETYRVELQPYAEDDTPLKPVRYHFDWTKDTFRWRLMAGAFFPQTKAARLEVNIESRDDRRKPVRFLIDDVAFIQDECAEAMTIVDAGEEAALAADGTGE